jgi:hypothetical protein
VSGAMHADDDHRSSFYRPPSGCRWCDIGQRFHCQRWTSEAGWHGYVPPEQHQIRDRMRARRAARFARTDPAAYVVELEKAERLGFLAACDEWTDGVDPLPEPIQAAAFQMLEDGLLPRFDLFRSTVHACPLEEHHGIMPCCGRPPFEVRSGRLTLQPELVTCRGAKAEAERAEARRDAEGRAFAIPLELS